MKGTPMPKRSLKPTALPKPSAPVRKSSPDSETGYKPIVGGGSYAGVKPRQSTSGPGKPVGKQTKAPKGL